MRNLKELIGQKVVALIEEDEINHFIKCEVLSVYIDDYYFHEKGECIQISVNLIPLNSVEDLLERGLEPEEFNQVSLDNITKYNNN